ncbi:MAG: leucine--tRNA ligase [Bacteroidota bacterium]
MSKEYDFKAIEQRWQQYWKEHHTYRTPDTSHLPKCYVLDMFPYPSGAGLHVGHPLGYIASDIYARYKRLKGFNVLHPMGYDAFGLPAEQYAIQTGQHPAVTTKQNIARYREQMDKIGFSYDWEREIKTCEPDYYRWTQWIFLQLFHSWYNTATNKAEHITTLIQQFEQKGFDGTDNSILTGGTEFELRNFSADEWKQMSEKQQQLTLQHFRLAYLSDAFVNWCPALGTVLSNDEVKDGVSERGGFPVERKLMKQWSLRITAYAERLLVDLEKIDWSESIKEAQRNWIGKSQGSSLFFKIQDTEFDVEVFTTRPDTLFGVSFIPLAPEHELIHELATAEYRDDVLSYIDYAKNRSERERMADVKKVTGQFTGAYALHPFTGAEIPVWIGDYVLAGYGTGAVMGVPAHDARDYRFAKHFALPVLPVIEPPAHETQFKGFEVESYDGKEGTLINSDFLNGLGVKKANRTAIDYIEQKGVGKGKTNYRLRDAIFGRQRYWGEPIPVYYKDGLPFPIPEQELPLVLPEIDSFLPTEDGEPPLARAKNWKYKGQYDYEWTTMPGWAGSSWYFLRYMDPQNSSELAGKEALNYWQNVDVYMGGSEHATGHLLYVRFWTKFLHDLGYIPVYEPAKKLINQGMIQGRSNFVYRVKDTNTYVSAGLKDTYETTALNVDVTIVENDVLDTAAFCSWREDFEGAEFILEDGKYICGVEVEKMSKSKWNVVTPDAIIDHYGADTLRLYEMFLGPLEQSKPWSTQGIEGVHRFLKKMWKLFYDANGNLIVEDAEPSKAEWKALHKVIRKTAEDIEAFSFNTTVSTFMICVNELTDLKCTKKSILSDLLICMASFAPHICEELWRALGNTQSITQAAFPVFKPEYLVEDSFSYPISINGKVRTNIEFSLQADAALVEQQVLADETVLKWLEGKAPKKVVFVKGRIVTVVV